MQSPRSPRSIAILAGSLALAGCLSTEPRQQAQAETPPPAASQPAAAAAEPAAATPAAKAKDDKAAKTKPKGKTEPATAPAAAAPADAGSYNLSKNKPVTDSTKVQAGEGTRVKGINDWEGEITGVPAANSKFTRLKIGMPLQQVIDLIGQPTDQGAHITGKTFIPFYFGSDKSRWEAVYKGQGRLLFSDQAGFSSGYYLTWIIYNSNEGGYR